MKEKAYIAGKITGDENFKEKFGRAKKYLESLGYTVLNPAELPEGMSPADYMRICLSMIDSSDIIYLLEDYLDSDGAQIEIRYAKYIGKTLKFEYLVRRYWKGSTSETDIANYLEGVRK